MKTNLLKMAAVFMAVASLTACSKKSDSKSKTELLTKAGWKYESDGVDANKDGTIDYPNVVDECEKDNVTTFATGGTGTIDVGTNKCDVSEEQTSSFTWQFKNGEKELEFDGETATITTLDDNHLSGYYEGDMGGGNVVRFYFTLKH